MPRKGTFPFGQPVKEVLQDDRSPKRIFVLGVYASAVHARWIGTNQKTIVKALAVASEPYIFWRGDNVNEIIEQINIPSALGKLVTANKQYNGPSGIALDDLILKPLGINRENAWLCDLVPHSCVNPSQNEAISRAYLPLVSKYCLPLPTVPEVPKQFTNEVRRAAIVGELMESGADILVLLGDKPIQWFLKYFDPRWKKLTDFTMDGQPYGRLNSTQIGSKTVKLLPLAHPRQIAKLGRSSVKWSDLHQNWILQDAHEVLQ